jgi:hypothetical protein
MKDGRHAELGAEASLVVAELECATSQTRVSLSANPRSRHWLTSEPFWTMFSQLACFGVK